MVPSVLKSEDADALLKLLNQQRKAFAYDGEEPDFAGDDPQDILARVEELVVAAEEA